MYHIKLTVRTYSYLTSIINTLVCVQARKQFTIMSKKQTKAEKAEQQTQVLYKPSEKEPLFGIVEIEGNKRIVLGDNVISSKTFAQVEEAEEYIASKPYELILNAAVLLFKFTQEQIKEEKK